MNRVFMIGNLTRDPEVRSTKSGTNVVSFTIAVSRRFSGKDGEKETDFIPVVAWKGLADLCAKYLSKGSKAAVTGSLQVRTYEDNSGNNRYIYEIVADEVEFLNSKKTEPSESVPTNGITTSTGKHIPADMIEIDDSEVLPF